MERFPKLKEQTADVEDKMETLNLLKANEIHEAIVV